MTGILARRLGRIPDQLSRARLDGDAPDDSGIDLDLGVRLEARLPLSIPQTQGRMPPGG